MCQLYFQITACYINICFHGIVWFSGQISGLGGLERLVIFYKAYLQEIVVSNSYFSLIRKSAKSCYKLTVIVFFRNLIGKRALYLTKLKLLIDCLITVNSL